MTMTQLKRTVKVESNDGEYLVDAAAYVPTRIRVEQYLAAGRRLDEFNRSLDWEDYDTAEAAEEAISDVTRKPGFDPADITAGEDKRSEIVAEVKKAANKSRVSASEQSEQGGDAAHSESDPPN